MKIGIIGSGIGGTSLAYFLKESLHSPELHIFEKNDRIGGRIKATNIEGEWFEQGATFFHETNQIMLNLANKLGLQRKAYKMPSYGIWNGRAFVSRSGKFKFMDDLKIFGSFPLSSYRFLQLIKKLKKEIPKVYDRLDRGGIVELDALLGKNLLEQFGKRSLFDVLSEHGISEKFARKFIEPAIRFIYDQGLEISAFAGLVAIIASEGESVYQIEGGNFQLLEKMVKLSEAELHFKTRITKIMKSEREYSLFSANRKVGEFDLVIIASPLEIAKIEFEKITLPPLLSQTYLQVSNTLVVGKIRPSYFGLSTKQMPTLILTTKDHDHPFTAIETLMETPQGDYVYNFISKTPAKIEDLETIFSDIRTVVAQDWEYAYPKIEPIKQLNPLVLDEDLYYLNAVECATTAMEASLIGSKNIANLITEKHGN